MKINNVNDDDYKTVTNDFIKLVDNLYKDINILYQTIKKYDNQTWRRAYVRSVFSSIESIIFNMKRFIKVIDKNDDLCLTKNERKKLDEYYTEKTIGGKEVIKIFHLSFLANIAFTIELFAYANYISIKIDKNSLGWKLLKDSVNIRNRITHPKSSKDIFIKKSELDKIYRTYKWFNTLIIKIHSDSYKRTMRQINNLKKAFNKNKKST